MELFISQNGFRAGNATDCRNAGTATISAAANRFKMVVLSRQCLLNTAPFCGSLLAGAQQKHFPPLRFIVANTNERKL